MYFTLRLVQANDADAYILFAQGAGSDNPVQISDPLSANRYRTQRPEFLCPLSSLPEFKSPSEWRFFVAASLGQVQGPLSIADHYATISIS